MPGMKNISFGGLNLISGDSQINCRSLLMCEHVFFVISSTSGFVYRFHGSYSHVYSGPPLHYIYLSSLAYQSTTSQKVKPFSIPQTVDVAIFLMILP